MPEPAPPPSKGEGLQKAPEATWIHIKTVGQPSPKPGATVNKGDVAELSEPVWVASAVGKQRLRELPGPEAQPWTKMLVRGWETPDPFCNGSHERGKDTGGLTSMVDISPSLLKSQTLHGTWVSGPRL